MEKTFLTNRFRVCFSVEYEAFGVGDVTRLSTEPTGGARPITPRDLTGIARQHGGDVLGHFDRRGEVRCHGGRQ